MFNSATFASSYSVPSSPPTNFNIAIVSSSAIELSWQLPPLSDRNGIITGYTIRVVRTDTGETFVDQITGGIGFSVTGLLPHTTYTCSVLASTSVGMGPATTLVTTTPQDGQAPLFYL